jgi:hypothetical protein
MNAACKHRNKRWAKCKPFWHRNGQRLAFVLYLVDVITIPQVHSEEVNELSGLFEICALLPVVESFSFCDQLRKRSSGTASAQLEFAGWQLIDEDPYWVPSTEEEVSAERTL